MHLKIVLVSCLVAVLGLVGMPAAAQAQPCEADPFSCAVTQATTAAECVVWNATHYSGPLKDIPGALVPDCFIHS